MNNESATASEESALKALQDILHNRIKQKKEEIHNPHSEAYKGSLSREIETLHWVLAKILTLKREYTNNSKLQKQQQQQQHRQGRNESKKEGKKNYYCYYQKVTGLTKSITESEEEESPLRLLEGILHNRIMQKKQVMHRTQKRSDIEMYILLLVEKIEERCLLGFVVCDVYQYYYYYQCCYLLLCEILLPIIVTNKHSSSCCRLC